MSNYRFLGVRKRKFDARLYLGTPVRFNAKVEIPIAIMCIAASAAAGWILAGINAAPIQ